MMKVHGFDFHVFVQLNDVYFIDARADYSRPGGLLLPRIGTMVQRLQHHLPGRVTFCVPGDFLAPSCLGKLTKGAHMVDIFNTIGVNFVTFGNHEFERPPFTPATLRQNVEQSNFTWLCANFVPSATDLVTQFAEKDKVKRYELVRLDDGLVVALTGLTLKDKYSGYGEADAPIDVAKMVFKEVRLNEPAIAAGADEPIFVAMTHQDANDDRELAKQCPEFLLLMGGHDHDEDYVIDQFRPMIVKAASNARTIRFNVLLHRRRTEGAPAPSPEELEELWLESRSRVLNRMFDTMTHAAADAAPESVRRLMKPPGGPTTSPGSAEKAFIDDTRLRSGIVQYGAFDVGLYSFAIDATADAVRDHIPEKPDTLARMAHWENSWDAQSGNKRTPILTVKIPFNARDGELRRKSTNMGNLAADALCTDLQGTSVAQIGLLNSGSLRIDRDLIKGEVVSRRTICDLLFFDNTAYVFKLSGSEIWQLLTKSFQLRSKGGTEGHGDFLQVSGLIVLWRGDVLKQVLRSDHRTFAEELPADGTLYRVSTTDYVATKSKAYEEIFKNKTPEVEIGDYNKMFFSAMRRLGSLTDDASLQRYYKITNDRWLPFEKHRDVFGAPL